MAESVGLFDVGGVAGGCTWREWFTTVVVVGDFAGGGTQPVGGGGGGGGCTSPADEPNLCGGGGPRRRMHLERMVYVLFVCWLFGGTPCRREPNRPFFS